MAEQNEPQEFVVEMPPPTDREASPRREKKKAWGLTQGKVFLGALGMMILFASYTLLSGGGSSSTPAPQPVTPGASGGAELDMALGEFARTGGSGGGVGQERAEVLSEIQEREALQQRIEAGQSAVLFGDPFQEELEPAPARPSSNVFGDVTPRTPPPAEPQRQAPPVAPISGTPSPMAPRAQPGAAPGNFDRIQYELDLAQRGTSSHTTISYSQAAAASARNQRSHPLTPGLDQILGSDGQAIAVRTGGAAAQETLALPGDLTVAYLSNRISSDQPSARVRVDILEGNLRGGRMLGEAAFEGERLILNFDQLVYDGQVFNNVRAVAVDPTTMDSSVQDGINRRLFVRYGLPVMVGIAGLGIDYQAHKRSPSVTETNLNTGETVTRRSNQANSFGEYAAIQAADGLKVPLNAIAQRAVSTPPEVWAQPGAIGLMFLTEVAR